MRNYTPEQIAKIKNAEAKIAAGVEKCVKHGLPNGDTAAKRAAVKSVVTEKGRVELGKTLDIMVENYQSTHAGEL